MQITDFIRRQFSKTVLDVLMVKAVQLFGCVLPIPVFSRKAKSVPVLLFQSGNPSFANALDHRRR